MAGTYPDVPGRRMAYDLDGTRIFRIDNANTLTELTATEARSLNDESTANPLTVGGENSGTNQLFFYFPEPRDLAGFFINQGGYSWGNPGVTAYVSSDTTTGLDGTWSTYVSGFGLPTGLTPVYRTSITAAASTGTRGLRFSSFIGRLNDFVTQVVHLYGAASTGANPDRLDLWHPTSDAPVTGAYFDWGNAQQGSTLTRTFRVKNRSSTLTANSVVLDTAPSNGELTPTSPTGVSQTAVSTGGAYAATASIGSLAPGAISSVLTLRRLTAFNAQISLSAMRVRAYAASWS